VGATFGIGALALLLNDSSAVATTTASVATGFDNVTSDQIRDIKNITIGLAVLVGVAVALIIAYPVAASVWRIYEKGGGK